MADHRLRDDAEPGATIVSSFVSTVLFAILAQITLAFIGVTSIANWDWGTILFWAQNQQALSRQRLVVVRPRRSVHRRRRHGADAHQLRHRRVRQPAVAARRRARWRCASARSTLAWDSRRSCGGSPRRAWPSTRRHRPLPRRSAGRCSTSATSSSTMATKPHRRTPCAVSTSPCTRARCSDSPASGLRQVDARVRGDPLGPPRGLITGGEVWFHPGGRSRRWTSCG